MSDPVIATKIKGFLYFHGENFDSVIVPVSSINLNFGLNGSLPGAVFVVPVGANVTNYTEKSTYSTIHDILKQLNPNTKIDCWLSMEGKQPNNEPWPEGYHLIWNGYFSGHGFTKQQGQLAITINSVHWLKDIDTGSVVSKNLVKGSFGDLLATSQYNNADAQTLGIDYTTYQDLAISASGQVKEYELVDLWRTILLPILIGLIQPSGGSLDGTELFYRDLVDTDLKSCNDTAAARKILADLGGPIGNILATKALLGLADNADITSAADSAKKGEWVPVSQSHKPLQSIDDISTNDPFIFGFNNDAEINTKTLGISAFLDYSYAYSTVASDIAIKCSGNIGSYSVYDKIRTTINNYTLSLVINARSATIATAIPVFTDELVWRVLAPNDYTGAATNSIYPESLSGVGLFNTSLAPLSQDPADMDTAQGLNSFFIASDTGRMLFINSPLWLLNKGISSNITKTSNNDSTINPVAGIDRVVSSDLTRTLKLAGCALSKSVWCGENFKHRTLQLSTPLRFDIAPGSCLAIDGINLDAYNNKSNDYKRAYGIVQSVIIDIDVNQPRASTTLIMSHVRNRGSDSYEADIIPSTHPMFTDDSSKWSGTPLVVINPATDLIQQKQA